jgi:hypothetical protein
VTRPLRELALIHLLANIAVLWLGYYWLGIGETRMATLAWSGLVALIVAMLACWTYGASFAFFQADQPGRVSSAWKAALRNLLPLAAAALGITVIYYLLSLWNDYSAHPASQVASYLTLKLRKPVRPSSVLRAFKIVLGLIRWALLPVLLLPMLSAISSQGWRGFQRIGALGKKWLYWIEAPLLLLCALWAPLAILDWVPHVRGFGLEAASFAMRAVIAYLLFVVAWLVLAFVTSGGTPRFTQSKTVGSP